MPIDPVLHKQDVGRHALIPVGFRRRKHAQLSACVLVVAVYAVTLAGCDRAGRGSTMSRTANTNISTSAGSRIPIPLPGRTLLNPQPEPDCELKATEPATDDLTKLEYERHCYRHAEMIVRSRLQLLQGSVGKTIKAIKRNEWSAPHQLSRD